MATMLIVVLALGFASIAHSIAVEYNQHNMAEYNQHNMAEYASDDNAEWERFKTTHSKTYDSTEEEDKRRMIFMNKLKKIQDHNSKFERGEVTYLQGINQYSDLTPDEVPKGLAPTRSDLELRADVLFHQLPPNVTVPKEVDWRNKGVVTKVKNQRDCGSCWAFSAIGALEGQVAIHSKKLVSLSEQNLVDCDIYDEGCSGGYPWTGFKYISENGINSEESYPYKGEEGRCRFNKTDIAATDKGWSQVKPTEDDLKIAVATVGPISVGIDASGGFADYKKGIYTSSECSSSLGSADHAVLVVGYGSTEKGEDYWLVKNSWGTTFGEKGYIKMARNHNNMCGIANNATYPIV